MIDVIGTDAGAPASLPAPQQTLLRAATVIAAPQRLQAALQDWLGDTKPELISSDDPRALVDSLQSRAADQAVAVLARISGSRPCRLTQSASCQGRPMRAKASCSDVGAG